MFNKVFQFSIYAMLSFSTLYAIKPTSELVRSENLEKGDNVVAKKMKKYKKTLFGAEVICNKHHQNCSIVSKGFSVYAINAPKSRANALENAKLNALDELVLYLRSEVSSEQVRNNIVNELTEEGDTKSATFSEVADKTKQLSLKTRQTLKGVTLIHHEYLEKDNMAVVTLAVSLLTMKVGDEFKSAMNKDLSNGNFGLSKVTKDRSDKSLDSNEHRGSSYNRMLNKD